jgi:NAD(P)-dependent dehydrogenase (short-subunit alcohol dehydrogenase family)
MWLGIGKGIVFAFARHAVKALALLDLNPKALETTCAELKAQYPNVEVRTFDTDVSNESSVMDAVNNTVQEFGRIDIAINCAGIGNRHVHTHEMPLDEWQKVVSVNQTGVWICQKYLMQQMLKQE